MFWSSVTAIFAIVLALFSIHNQIWMKRKKWLIPLGKCVFITGCDSGVGLSLAITSRALGFQVISSCLDDSSEGARLLKDKYPDILVIQLDVTRPEDVERAKENVLQHLQQTNTELWAVVNNAGVLIYGHFDWQLEHQVMSQLQVNLMGVFSVTRALLPLVRKAKGRIINITSANGHWCLPGLSIYCATKHAIDGFSHALRMELIPWGVKVILINPGNLPGSTRLLANQARQAEAMRQAMSEQDRLIYGDYFESFQKHLQTNFASGPQQGTPLNDAELNSVLKSALLLENPSHYYENLTIGFRLFIALFKVLPVYYGDRLYLRIWGSAIGHQLI